MAPYNHLPFVSKVLTLLESLFLFLANLSRAESDGVIRLLTGITGPQSSSTTFIVGVDIGVGTVLL